MALPVVISRIQNRRGTQSQFNGASAIYPPGYDGVGGYGSIAGFDSTNYPNVLLPGEIALCTDTRLSFIGNVNGEYVEISTIASPEIKLTPLVISLPPTAISTVIPVLTHLPTPFLSLLYSLSDVVTVDPNIIGINYSKNGELKITAVVDFVPAPAIPPFPPLLPVTLVDSGTEINTTIFDINFSANYNLGGTLIEISYTHDFPANLTFSTGTVIWAAI